MEQYDTVLALVSEAESLLFDIFLSGFSGISAASVKKAEELEGCFSQYGMEQGSSLLRQLAILLQRQRSSFHGEETALSALFCTFEFYLENAKAAIG